MGGTHWWRREGIDVWLRGSMMLVWLIAGYSEQKWLGVLLSKEIIYNCLEHYLLNGFLDVWEPKRVYGEVIQDQSFPNVWTSRKRWCLWNPLYNGY